MAKKATYEELEKRVKELEKEVVERRRAEEEVLLHREIVEKMAEGVYLIRTGDGVIVYVNKTFERMFGYDPGELVNKHVSVVNAPSEKIPEEIANDIIRSLKEKGTWSGEVHNIKKDGTPFWCHANVSTFDHHDFGEVWVSVHQDIGKRKKVEEELKKHRDHLEELVEERTVKLAEANEQLKQKIEERRRAEEALRESEERYRQLFQGISDAVMVYSPQGRFLECNEATLKRLGYTHLEFLRLRLSDVVHPDFHPVMKENHKRIWAGEATVVESAHRCKDGRFIPVEVNARRIEYKGEWAILAVVRDLTERQLAEEERNELLKTIETTQESISIISPGLVILYTNDSMNKLFGYKKGELLGKHVSIVNAGPTPEAIAKEIANTIEEKGWWEGEVHNKRKDGTEFISHATTSAYKDKDGKTITFVLTQHDITEQKRAEEQLKESEEKYRTLVHEIRDGFFITDNKGTITLLNKALAEMLGYENPEEILGRTFLEFLPPEMRDEIMAKFKRAIKDGNFSELVEFHIIRKDGSIIFVQLKPAPVMEENRIVGTRGVIRDITERKQAEEALRESEERYRLLVENANEGIWVSQDEKLVFCNPKAKKILGYEGKELPDLSFNRFVHPDDLDMATDRHKRRMRGEKVVDPYPFRIVDGYGNTKWVEGNAVRIVWKGKPATLTLVSDITEQVKAKEEKKELEAQLQRAQKMEVIGTFAGGVALDLKDILAGLVSYPELLLMGIPERSPLRRPILAMQESGEKAAAIVQDLLTLARRGVAATEVVNLNDIISEYLKSPEDERLESFHPNVQFKTELETDLLNILGSPAHLSKTVMNLLSNAAEATPYGGEIFISTENRYVDRPISGYDHIEEGDYVILTVSDTGEGISPEEMERIFEPFYTKKMMGRRCTGLGMTVVWGTVKDHNGYIDVKSSEGKGTTFTLYFPVSRKEVAKDQSLVSIEDYMGKEESVLVVDDVAEQREIASRILKKLGYSVTAVSGGEEAVDYMKDNSADLLLLDMIMDPGIDGLETYKRILKYHPNQKAIIVSGFSETKRVKEAQGLGVGAYVKKPFLLQKIGLAIRDELDR